MKKGFTLIELLAVLVILALIIVIVLPEILDSIREARQSALESSGRSVYKSIETQINKMNMGLEHVTLQEYDFDSMSALFPECPVDLWTTNDADCAYLLEFDEELQNGYELGIFLYNTTGKYRGAEEIIIAEFPDAVSGEISLSTLSFEDYFGEPNPSGVLPNYPVIEE